MSLLQPLFVTTLALGILAAVPAWAQAPGHGTMPGMRMPGEGETRGERAAEEAHGGMEMPEPMERPIPDTGVPRATETKGGQPLPYKVVDGVKVFELTAKPVKWLILPKFKSQPDIWATAWSYNSQIPGP